MNVLVMALVLAAASDAPVVTGAAGDTPVFTRDEPNLAAGRRALLADDVDTAVERFRRAAATTDSERAVVEYDVGQALTLRALAEAKAAQQQAAPPQGPNPGGPPAPPTPPNVDDAVAAFERAATLAREPRLVSEARLAAGNAAMVGGKLDDAIGQLRRALVADPQNERARRNLQRALTLKQQQPPPPPQEGGDGDQKDGDQKDDDQQQQDGDKKDGDQQQQDGDNKDGDQQQQNGDKKDGDNKDGEQQQQDGDNKDGKQHQQDGDKKDGEQPKPADGDASKDGQAPAPKPKPTSKEEARRLLQGLRSRERPLSPLEMRGTEQRTPATAGKDW